MKSLILAAAVLLEYARITARREKMFLRLGDTRAPSRRLVRFAIVALYLFTTALIAAVSAYVFFS